MALLYFKWRFYRFLATHHLTLKIIKFLSFNQFKYQEIYKKFKYYEDLYLEKKVKEYKWGISYSLFDGEELLEASLVNVRPHVDYINVVYQLTSWYGVPANEGLMNLLEELKQKGLIDELIDFTPNFKIHASKNEINKRNVGLMAAKKNGCNYFMSRDVDEFYISSEMENAKKFLIKENITHSYTVQTIYGTTPTQKSTNFPINKSFFPFFGKLRFYSKLGTPNSKIPCKIDTNRSLNSYFGSRYYVLNNITMHHMSFLRQDIYKKFNNAIYDPWVKYNNSEIDEYMERFQNNNFVTVEDIFSINYFMNKIV